MTEVERYHLTQYDKPYESTAAFADFIRSVTDSVALTGRVIDVGCGAGANIHWLDQWGVTKGCDVTGIDSVQPWLQVARARNPTRSFVLADFRDPLPPCETSLSIQTLSFIEDWRPALRELLAATKEWLFASSLFWEGVETHTHASDGDKVSAHYNVIDTIAFTNACIRWGGEVRTWRAFSSSNPIVAPREQLRSRTSKGLTFSGPLYMPWAFVAVRKT